MLTTDQETEIDFFVNIFSEITYKGIIYYNDFPEESLNMLFILDYYKPFDELSPIFEQFKEVMMDGFEMLQKDPDKQEHWKKYLAYKEKKLEELKQSKILPNVDNIAIRPYVTEFIKEQMLSAIEQYKIYKNTPKG
jgi:hypothetical protein